MSQTTAPKINADVGEVGQIAECFGPASVRTGTSQAANTFVGRLVKHGTAEGEVANIAATGDISTGGQLAGVVARRLSRVSKSDGLDPNFEANESMPVVRKGYVYVKVQNAVAKDAPAFARHASGNEGQFRSDADGGNATAVPNAYFRSAAGAGEVAVLEIDLP